MFLFVAFICFSSAIIVSSIAHSHSHNHSHSHSHSHPNHLGLVLGGIDDNLGLGGINRDEEGAVDHDNHHAHGSYYEPIGDEPSPRTPATP